MSDAACSAVLSAAINNTLCTVHIFVQSFPALISKVMVEDRSVNSYSLLIILYYNVCSELHVPGIFLGKVKYR
jgi:hypothetical protein